MKSQTLLTLSTILILLIHACNEPQESTTTSISFSIEGYGKDTIRLFQIEPFGFARINTQELIVDESGSGTIEITYSANSFVRFQIGDFFFSIINTIGSDLVIGGKAMDLPNTLTVSGEGSLPINYILTKDKIIRKHTEQNGRFILQLDSTEFWARLSALNEEIDSLNTWLASQPINPELESLLVLESQQRSNAFILNYALMKRYTDARYAVEVPYDKNLFMSFSTLYSIVLALNYDHQISGPAWATSGASDNDSIAYIFPRILSETIENLGIPGYAKEYYIAKMLIRSFRSHQSSPVIEEVYTHWQKKYPESVYRKPIIEAIDGMSSLARGEQAPIIMGIDPYGNDFTLEQLKGKVIFIDVWATWCSPCVKGIPKMYVLQEEYKDNPLIKFLFVSVDKDLDKWRRYISKLPADGLHINSYNTGLYQDYMIGGVPHYIIIDASGNIYQSKAQGPDSDEIRSLLEEAIKLAS
jgi:thiol-disulfide isomerase/thioredoxin